jgi:hypothetical protein
MPNYSHPPDADGSPRLLEITPRLARQWLDQNKGNRPRKTRAIDAYARDMAAGKWLVTGESIKFGTDGSLKDGQNRLHAVILSGVSIKSWVMFGLDPRVQDVMDAGVKRSNGDQLTIRGVTNANAVSTIAAAWTGWADRRWPSAVSAVSSPVLTHSETIQFVDDHPEVTTASTLAVTTSKVLRLPAGVIGAAWMILAGINEEDATNFFRKIREGEFAGKGDPLVTLTRRAQLDRDQGRASRPGPSFYLIFRTWNAWRDGESLGILKTIHSNGVAIAMLTPH